MNKITANIKNIINHDDIVLIEASFKDDIFSILMLDESSLNIKKDSKVELLFKEQELILSKINENIYIENHFKAKITKITKSKILSQIELLYGDFTLRAILNSKFVDEFFIDDFVFCYIKSNDIIIKV